MKKIMLLVMMVTLINLVFAYDLVLTLPNRNNVSGSGYDMILTMGEELPSGDVINLTIALVYPLLNHTNVSQNTWFNVTVNVSCYDANCGSINVSLDPYPIANIPPKREWYIEKTGAEINLDVRYTELDSTSTEFCITHLDKAKYESDLLLTAKDINSVPLTKISKDSYQLDKAIIDLSKSEDCFVVNYNSNDYINFKIGWDSIIVDSEIGGTTATQVTPNENIVKDSLGNLHVGYRGGGNDLWYGNSSDDGNTWDIKEILATSLASVGITINGNDLLLLYSYLAPAAGVASVYIYNSSDYGVTWNGPQNIFTANTYGAGIDFGSASCISDNDNIFHCCAVDQENKTLYYTNSTIWNEIIPVNLNKADQTDFCDIEADSNDCVYIIGYGTDDTDIDIWSPCLDGWGDTNKIPVDEDGESVSIPTMTISNNDDIYIAYAKNSDLWFANSSDGGSTWTTQELDSASTSYSDIGVDTNGSIYIIYMNITAGTPYLFLANSTDNGTTWTIRTDLEHNDSFYPSIQDSRYPLTNRITTRLNYLYTYETGSELYFDNITLYDEGAAPPSPPPVFNVTTKGGLIPTDPTSTPFWTNESNPRTISLNQGGSQLVTFYVNATGVINATTQYLFFANASVVSNMTISDTTDNFYITINQTGAVATTCDCPASGGWFINDGSTCTLSTVCNIAGEPVIISGGSVLYIIPGGELYSLNVEARDGKFENRGGKFEAG